MHQGKVGLNRLGLVAVNFVGNLPQILPVIELLGIAHVIGQQLFRLHGKQIDRVAEVRSNGRRALVDWAQEFREHRLPTANQRIIPIGHIKPHRAVIGINHRFHGIANVIKTGAAGFGIGITAAGGVAIHNPKQVAAAIEPIGIRRRLQVHGHGVGIAIELQEGGDRPYPFPHIPPPEQARVRREVIGQQ